MSKRCDVCLNQFFEGDSIAVDYSWSMDVQKPLEYHIGCFFEKKDFRKNLVDSLVVPDSVEPPLGYWYFKENALVFSEKLTPQKKVELIYYDCPALEELYN